MAFKDTYGIDASQADRAIKALDSSLAKLEKTSDRGAEKLSKEERAARRLNEQADPTLKYARNMDNLAKAVQSGGVEMDNAQKLALKYTERLDRAQGAGNKAFGSEMIQRIAGTAAGIVSVNSVLSIARQVFEEIDQAAEGAYERMRQSINAIGELQQLSDFSGNREAVNDLVRRGIADNSSQAAGIIFQLGSSGIRGEDREFLLNEVAATKLVAPDRLATFASSVQKARGTLGLGSFEEATQKILQTSESTDTDATSIATASTVFGSELAGLGFSGDAGLAALTTIIQKSPNQQIAANRLAAFLRTVDKSDLSKGSLAATVGDIRRRVAGGEKLSDIIPESRAKAGASILLDSQGFFNEQLGLIGAAPEADIVGVRGQALRQDDTLRAGLLAEEAEGSLQVAQAKRFARGKSLLRAVRARRRERAIKQGRLDEFLVEADISLEDGTLGSILTPTAADKIAAALGRELNAGLGGDGGAFSAAFEEEMRQYLRDTANGSQRTADAVEGGANPSEE